MANATERTGSSGDAEQLELPGGVGRFQFDSLQSEVDRLTRDRLAAGRRGLVCAPTGFGKGVMLTSAAQAVRDGVAGSRADGKTPRVLVICPSVDLLGQNLERLHAAGVIADRGEASVLCSPQNRPNWPGSDNQKAINGAGGEVVIATQNMVQKMRDTEAGRAALADYDAVLFDEAHRALANKIGQALSLFDVPVIGYTATPFREDDRDVQAAFGGNDAEIRTITRREAIEADRIVPGRVVGGARGEFREQIGREHAWNIDRQIEGQVAEGTDIEEASRRAVGKLFRPEADDEQRALAGAMSRATVEMWKRYASDRITLVHAENIDHSRALFDAFAQADVHGRPVSALALDSSEIRVCRHGNVETIRQPEANRRRADLLDEARAGAFDVISNCQVMREGIDIPCVSASINACQNKGFLAFMQSVAGRGSRTYQDPMTGARKQDHLIIDLGNTIGRIANQDPRCKDGDIDMRGVKAIASSADAVTDAIDAMGDNLAEVRRAARDYAADTRTRQATEDRDGIGAPGLPDDALAEGVQVIGEVNHAGEPDPFGSGSRVYTDTRRTGNVKLGSGTVLGATARDPETGNPNRYAVYFDRHGLHQMPSANLETIAAARARGVMGREDAIQRSWAAQDKLPASIADVLENHGGFWRESAERHDMTPGDRVYSWGRPNKGNADKVGTGTLLHVDPTQSGRRTMIVMRTDDAQIRRVPLATLMPEKTAQRDGLVFTDTDGTARGLTPGTMDALAQGRPADPDGRPIYEPGERAFAYKGRDPHGNFAGGYGRVVADTEREGRHGSVVHYTIALDDGRRVDAAPRDLKPDAEAQRAGLRQADADRHCARMTGARVAADVPNEDPAPTRQPNTIAFETLGRGYSADRVADYVTDKEAREARYREAARQERAMRDSARAAPRDSSAPPRPSARSAGDPREPEQPNRQSQGAPDRIHRHRTQSGAWLAGVTRRDDNGAYSSAAAIVCPVNVVREAAGMPGDDADNPRPNNPAQDDPRRIVAAALGPDRIVHKLVNSDAEAVGFLQKQGLAPQHDAEARHNARHLTQPPTQRQLYALTQSRDAASIRSLCGESGDPQNRAEASATIALSKSWPDLRKRMAATLSLANLQGAQKNWFDAVKDSAVMADPDRKLREGNEAAVAAAIIRRNPERRIHFLGDPKHPPHHRLVYELRKQGSQTQMVDPATLRQDQAAAARALKLALDTGTVQTAGQNRNVERAISEAIEAPQKADTTPARQAPSRPSIPTSGRREKAHEPR